MSFNITANTGSGFNITIGGGGPITRNITTTNAIAVSTQGILTNFILRPITCTTNIITLVGGLETSDITGRLKYANAETNNLSQFDDLSEAQNIVASTIAKAHESYGFNIPFNGTLVTQAVHHTFTGRTADTYSRFYIYFPSGYTFGSGISWIMEGITSAWGSTIALGLVTSSGVPTHFRIQVASNYTDVALSLDAWTCIELRHVINGASSGGQCWINGNLEFTNYTENVGAATLDRIRWGFNQGSAPQNGAYIYFDDCVIDDSYIGLYPQPSFTYLSRKINVTCTASISFITGTAPQNLISNSFDWVDTNSDGIADGWQRNYGTENCSIVTGNGFTGNAQRMVATTGGTAQAISPTGITLAENTPYLLRFKYRSSNTLVIFEGVENAFASFGTNTGNAIQVEWAFYAKLGGTQDLRFFAQETSEWIEIDEVELFVLPIATLKTNFIPSASSNFDTDGTAWWGGGTHSWNASGYMEGDGYLFKGMYDINITPYSYNRLSFRVRSSTSTSRFHCYINSTTNTNFYSKNITSSWQLFEGIVQAKQHDWAELYIIHQAAGVDVDMDDILLEEFLPLATATSLGVKKNITVTSAIILNTSSDGLGRFVNITATASLVVDTAGILELPTGQTLNVTTAQAITVETTATQLKSKINAISTQSIIVDTTGILTNKKLAIIISAIQVNTTAIQTRKINLIETCSIVVQTSAILTRKFALTETCNIAVQTSSMLNVRKALSGTAVIVFSTAPPELHRKIDIGHVFAIIIVSTPIGDLQNQKPLTLFINKSIICTANIQVSTSASITNAKQLTGTCSLQTSITAVQTKKINLTITQNLVTDSFGALTLQGVLTCSSYIYTETSTVTANRKIALTETNNLSISTTAIVKRKMPVITTQAISFTITAIQKKKISINTTQAIATTSIATELFYTTQRLLTSSQSIVTSTASILSNKKSATSTQILTVQTSSTQVKCLISATETCSLVVSTTGILSNNKTLTETSTIQVSTSAIQTRKINLTTIQNIQTDSFGALGIQGLWECSSYIYTQTSSVTANRKINIFETNTPQILTTATQVKSKVNKTITVGIVSSTSSIIKRKVNISTISQIVSNTTGLIYRRFGVISTSIIIINISAILKRRVNVSITSAINSATTTVLTKKVNITTNQSIILSTTATLSIPGIVSIHSSIVSSTSAILSRKINITCSSSLSIITTATLNKKINVFTNQSFVLSTTATKVLGKRSVITTQALVINTTGLLHRKFNASIGVVLSLSTTASLKVKKSVVSLNQITLTTSGILSSKKNTSVFVSIVSETQGRLLAKKNVASIVEIVLNTQGQELFDKINVITSNNITTTFEALLHVTTNVQLSCNITTEFSATLDLAISENFGGKELFFNLYINTKLGFNLEITPYEIEENLILNSEVLIDLDGLGYEETFIDLFLNSEYKINLEI